jgi:hypothetical protein
MLGRRLVRAGKYFLDHVLAPAARVDPGRYVLARLARVPRLGSRHGECGALVAFGK